MLHMCVQRRHRARAGQEEHSSQGTAQRQKLRSETPQKLGQQVIPSSGSFREGGKGFLNCRALRVKSVCVSIGIQMFIAASPECRMLRVKKKPVRTLPNVLSKHGKTGLLYPASIQACLAEMALS